MGLVGMRGNVVVFKGRVEGCREGGWNFCPVGGGHVSDTVPEAIADVVGGHNTTLL